MNRIKTILAYAFVAVLMWAAFSSVGEAQEFPPEQHFVVAIYACHTDGHCEHFRRPLDADNSVACAMKAGMVGAVMWAQEHPGWTLKEIHCAKDGESDL